jgi:hypothetical protein
VVYQTHPFKEVVVFKNAVFSLLIGVGTFYPADASADVVTDWNQAALRAIRSSGTTPPAASRALAIVHVAIFDAVNAITRAYDTYAVHSNVPASASPEAAASAAALTALSALFPGSVAEFERLHSQVMLTIANGPQKDEGAAWGERAAELVLLSRTADNSDAVVAAPSGSTSGVWQPTAPAYLPYLLPQWGRVTPFVLPAGDFVRPAGPPALDTAEWAAEFNEVKTFGAAEGSGRTAEQDLIALFWADGGGTETPPGHWNQIAQRVSLQRPGTLTDRARLFAMLNVAMADAGVCAWDAKYVFNFWRPITAIQNADADGNADTTADLSWSPFIVTPPFPEYVSGHSTFSGAAATVLAGFYGTDRVAFSITSDGTPGIWRTFESFSAAAGEAAISRLYGGIHFRSAIEDGLAMGVEVANWTLEHYFTEESNRSRK